MRKIATITALGAALTMAVAAVPVTSADASTRVMAPAKRLAVTRTAPSRAFMAQNNRYRLRYRRPFVRRAPRFRQPRTFGARPSYRVGRPSRILPLSRVARGARAAVPGQFRGGRLIGNVYLIKILSYSGRLVYVYADARTGRIVRIRR